MKFIDRIRKNSLRSIDKRMKQEYKYVIAKIKKWSMQGKYTCIYELQQHYDNKREVYSYIMDKLKEQGFDVEYELYGINSSWGRLRIKWDTDKEKKRNVRSKFYENCIK